jgi:ABC-2 type transport system permease protein
LKTSFVVFLRRNLAFAKLAIVSNLEYRLNYLVDALAQPILTTFIEILLWSAVFTGAGVLEINGFAKEYYLSYALWGAFFARIAASWMYEFRMIAEVESGTLNGLLVRPMSFYEYYFSQLMGYKFMTTALSLIIPFVAASVFELPTHYSRVPMAMALCLYYLVLVHSISFVISCFAFHFNKIHSFTTAKNLLFWVLTGELFPLDLVPEPWRQILTDLPFSSGVYIPVGYITGRVDFHLVKQGFLSVTVGIVVVNILGAVLWRRGLKVYAGTGA